MQNNHHARFSPVIDLSDHFFVFIVLQNGHLSFLNLISNLLKFRLILFEKFLAYNHLLKSEEHGDLGHMLAEGVVDVAEGEHAEVVGHRFKL